MSWELAPSFEPNFPPLKLLPEPEPLSVIELPVHEAIWKITQPETDFEKMLQKPKYQKIFLKLYSEKGIQQSVEDKIKLLESHIWPCTIPGSREQILQYLEFWYLCDTGALDEDDFNAFCL